MNTRYDVLLCDADNTIFDFNQAEENAFALTCAYMGFESSDELLKTYSQINSALWKLLEQGGITQKVLRVRRFEQFLEAIGRSELDAQDVPTLSRIVGVWRKHRDALYQADVTPIGLKPNGFSFTGFYADCGERENVQMLRLRYRDCGLSMLIALPEVGGVDAVLDGLCAEGLGYFIFREEAAKVKLSMPKTDIDVTNPLTETLQALGVARAFSDGADFSGITEDAPLKIGSVIQKARLILDEDGTRAAAATVMAMATGAMPQPEEIVEFRMDRPFVFVIADELSGVVCFAGVVASPDGN